MPTVREIYEYINSFAPFSSQESWDNSGLLLGDPDRQVKTVAVVLDATKKTVEAAKKAQADMIVTHHPVIFSPLKKITAGSVVYDLLTNDISVVSAHTCWDSAAGGVNDTLAEILGFENKIAIGIRLFGNCNPNRYPLNLKRLNIISIPSGFHHNLSS